MRRCFVRQHGSNAHVPIDCSQGGITVIRWVRMQALSRGFIVIGYLASSDANTKSARAAVLTLGRGSISYPKAG